MKILLFGKHGQLGWELQRSLAPLGELVALSRQAETHSLFPGTPLHGNFLQLDALAETVRRVRPDLIVNAAAYTAVDQAESDIETASIVNAEAVAVLAQQAARLGAALVHYSTDYVFDGSGECPRRESDVPAPLNVYGHTKLAGELAVQQHCPRHLIFRTSWVYGARGNNFAKTILRLGQERTTLNVIADQIGAPTGAELIADVTAHAIRHLQREPACAGLYHLAAGGATSWHGYASHVLQAARARGLAISAQPASVLPASAASYPAKAVRPANSRLDTTRLRQTFGIHLPDWRIGLDRMLSEILSCPA